MKTFFYELATFEHSCVNPAFMKVIKTVAYHNGKVDGGDVVVERSYRLVGLVVPVPPGLVGDRAVVGMVRDVHPLDGLLEDVGTLLPDHRLHSALAGHELVVVLQGEQVHGGGGR